LFFSVDPGEHHLCASPQSNLKRLSGQRFATDFTAEAGKTYFFQAQVHVQGNGGTDEPWSIDLHPATAADAKYLIANSPLSVSHTKK
jgi:succinylglutamate desuccinylase